VFEIVGFNDSFFRHALGDYDYGRRARKLGIESYVVPGILGKCDEHADTAIWCNPNYSLAKRWKYFRSPLGQNPEEYFVYDLRHNGFLSAVCHYLSIHLRLLLPSLWLKYRQ
jgi:GT2 family glycosyltransferase